MSNKLTSNLFANFDDTGTEANAEIIKNSIHNSKNTIINNQVTKDITEENNIQYKISSSSNLINTKLENLATKLPKPTSDKKSYMTIYLKKSVQVKIDEIAKKLRISNGSVIELLINEFEQI